MSQRPGAVTFKGNPMTLVGNEVKPGDKAPDFQLVGTDLSEKRLADFKGKTIVLNVVPSLDTPVCDKQTRRFNEEAAKLGNDTVIVTVSKDLPFAQKRWCAAAGIDKVVPLSDYKHNSFGQQYGLLIQELGLLARAVLIVDKQGKVQYVQLVKEVATEPNYDEALQKVKAIA